MTGGTPLGLIAGSGELPRIIADRLAAEGRSCLVLAVAPEPEAWVGKFSHVQLHAGDIAGVLEHLQAGGCREVCMAGGVRRPALHEVPGSASNRAVLRRLEPVLRAGDGTLLAAILQLFADSGLVVRGAQELVPELLIPAGPVAGGAPDAGFRADLARAAEIVDAIGRAGVGQAAVVAGGRCLGVEVVDGTAAMLARIPALPAALRGVGGVLYKAPSPGQDWRVDLPAIGPDTVRQVARAGLQGIALRAGAGLMLGGAAVTEAARAARLIVYGHDPERDSRAPATEASA